VLFLARDLEIVDLRRAVKPWRIAACFRAHSVIELPPGTIAATDTRVGDRMELRRQAQEPN
jgi:uncharacterized membrane protein (UPF0127 family)